MVNMPIFEPRLVIITLAAITKLVIENVSEQLAAIVIEIEAAQTEAAIDPGFTRDLYVSLGEPLDSQKNAWAVRVYHKPFIRWIWLGSLFMLAGGMLAAANKRYRRKIPEVKTSAAETKEVTA